MSSICVIGMGYVGLTLAAAFAKKGHNVIGLEKSEELVSKINSYEVPFVDQGLDKTLREVLVSRRLEVTSSLEDFPVQLDFVIIAIGTPISELNVTDLSNFTEISKGLAGKIAPNCIVILRSTVPVGTTRALGAIFHDQGLGVQVSFCPERTVEGVALNELFELPQIVSGENMSSLRNAADLFLSITPDVVTVTSLETAELIKLSSNMWRDFTFAFSNELFRLTRNFEVDILEMIRAANHNYARNQIPKPGGVGGPCLTKDTYIFNQSIGSHQNIFTEARQVNAGFPGEVIKAISKSNLLRGNVGICGWAFKGNPPTSDLRFSPTLDYFSGLVAITGLERLYGWDPEPINLHDLPENLKYVNSFTDLLSFTDCLIIANDHPFYSSHSFVSITTQSNKELTILDLWNVVPDLVREKHRVVTLGELK